MARRSLKRPALRMWHLGDDIAIVSFKTKMNTVNDDVLDGLQGDRPGREALRGARALADAMNRSRSVQTSPSLALPCRPAVGRRRRDGRKLPSGPAAPASFAWCPWLPQCVAWPWVAAARFRCTATARSRRWSAISAWSKPASACCRRAAAARNSSCACAQLAAARWAARSINSVPAHLFSERRDGQGFEERARSQGTRPAAARTTSWSSMPTNCCMWRRPRRARWRNPAIGRRCRARRSRSPVTYRHRHVEMMLVNMLEGRFISPHDFESPARSRACSAAARSTPLAGRRALAARSRTPRLRDAVAQTRKDPGTHRAHTLEPRASRCGTKGPPMATTDTKTPTSSPPPAPRSARRRAVYSATRVPTTCWRMCSERRRTGAALDPSAHRRRHHRLRDARRRARHERRAHRRAAGRPARRVCGHDDQPLLLVRTARRGDRRRPHPHRRGRPDARRRHREHVDGADDRPPSRSTPASSSDENLGIAFGMGITAENVAAAMEGHARGRRMRSRSPSTRRRSPRRPPANSRRDQPVSRSPTARPTSPPRDVRDVTASVTADEGPRPTPRSKALGKLRPVFAANGSVTAGNTSQMSDGAGARCWCPNA